MANACVCCKSNRLEKLIELGSQPPSNRYLTSEEEKCETHPLEFGYCSACGIGQLINPMPPDMVRSHFDWITYNEPEGHLDDLVETLAAKIGISSGTRVFGVTYKDDSTLLRFNRKGVSDTYRIKEKEDLNIQESHASLETIQSTLSQSIAKKFASINGQADIVLVRHILEHAHDPRQLLEACLQLCKPGGLLVLEVPDCRKVLEGHDHCFIWEEHISYFTPETLRGFLEGCGLADLEIKSYPYPMEDSLIAIVRNVRAPTQDAPMEVASEIARLRDFAYSFSSRGLNIKRHLQALQAQGKKVFLFGAGHLAAKFINFYGLAPYLSGVIDDNPNKLGRFMPGSKLPIVGSRCLDSGDADLCLLTLNPESEQKVLKAKADYLSRGGKFRSIFSASTNSIDRDIRNDPT